jgi:hypothetical protein
VLGGGSGAELPVIDSLSLLRDRFAVGSSATALSARRRRSTPRGTEFRYTLNKAATVTIRVERVLAGRKVGRKCLAATRRRRFKPRCTRFSLAGTLTRRAQAGSNKTVFSGRIGRRTLGLGTYRAVATAIDAAGAKSASRHVFFTVVRGAAAAQPAISSGRPNARSNRSTWRSAAQRATLASPSVTSSSVTFPLSVAMRASRTI